MPFIRGCERPRGWTRSTILFDLEDDPIPDLLRAGRCQSKCAILEVATFQQRQQPLGLRDLRRDNTRRKPLARPLRIERKGSKKCGLHLQNLERTYPAVPRQPNYHLLDPDRAQRLREVGIANDLTRKVELLAGDGVGIMR